MIFFDFFWHMFSQTLNAWCSYLHLVDFYGKLNLGLGKYTMRGVFGLRKIWKTKDLTCPGKKWGFYTNQFTLTLYQEEKQHDNFTVIFSAGTMSMSQRFCCFLSSLTIMGAQNWWFGDPPKNPAIHSQTVKPLLFGGCQLILRDAYFCKELLFIYIFGSSRFFVNHQSLAALIASKNMWGLLRKEKHEKNVWCPLGLSWNT